MQCHGDAPALTRRPGGLVPRPRAGPGCRLRMRCVELFNLFKLLRRLPFSQHIMRDSTNRLARDVKFSKLRPLRVSPTLSSPFRRRAALRKLCTEVCQSRARTADPDSVRHPPAHSFKCRSAAVAGLGSSHQEAPRRTVRSLDRMSTGAVWKQRWRGLRRDGRGGSAAERACDGRRDGARPPPDEA
jgi:hypothetical protein